MNPSNSLPSFPKTVATNPSVVAPLRPPASASLTRKEEVPAAATPKPPVAVLQSSAPASPAPVFEQAKVKVAAVPKPDSNEEAAAEAPIIPPKKERAPVVKPTVTVKPAAAAPTAPSVNASANASSTLSKATALQLLQKGNSHVSARSQNRVLQIVSGRTAVNEPPQSWRVLYSDEKATYKAVEVRFEGGEMERVYEPSRILDLFSFGSPKTLDLTKVKIDSEQAIRLAVRECETEEVTVKFVELKLERGYGGLPVWNVKLFGMAPGKPNEDAALGFVILLAEDGKLLKKDTVTKSEKSASRK